jgi:hypothetical protein
MSRPHRFATRPLVLTLLLLGLVPSAGAAADVDRPAAAATGSGPLIAGYGEVTATDRREIDRVVAASRAAGRPAPAASRDARITSREAARAVVDEAVLCATFEGQRYCLGTGWTDLTQAQAQARALALLEHSSRDMRATTTTGDLSAYDALRRVAQMSEAERARAQRAELTQAARSVAKVWLIRHEVEGVPLPEGFLARHPEVRRVADGPAGSADATLPHGNGGVERTKRWRDYPRQGLVLRAKHVAQQRRTYWCGPTTMQMIAWGWSHTKRSQAHWARRLGTTTDGTAITDMVRVVNEDTGYDRPSYAGPYITLDIGDWSFGQWKLLMARHIVDYRAPVVLHPVLLKRFFPYLDHDGSGHFQVGRGYRKRDGKAPLLGYFEPWNQQRFHPDEPFIARVQWGNAYQSYRANQAHFQHNLGV